MNDNMKRHLSNLSNQVGGDVSNKYHYITSSAELEKSFYQSRKDLHYALKKETKRDRYIVMNAEALEKAIAELCAQAVEESEGPLGEYLESKAYDVFSGFATGTTTKRSKNQFITIFAKAFVKGAFKLFEQSMNNNDD